MANCVSKNENYATLRDLFTLNQMARAVSQFIANNASRLHKAEYSKTKLPTIRPKINCHYFVKWKAKKEQMCAPYARPPLDRWYWQQIGRFERNENIYDLLSLISIVVTRPNQEIDVDLVDFFAVHIWSGRFMRTIAHMGVQCVFDLDIRMNAQICSR